MKKILLAACLLAATTAQAQRTTKKPVIKIKIDYILKYDDGTGEVWAVHKPPYNKLRKYWYMAYFLDRPIPDSLELGKVLYLHPAESMPDSCSCVQFNRWIKKDMRVNKAKRQQ